MTKEEMEDAFDEIPLEGLVCDSGIWEFHKEGNKSIGVSYEHIGTYDGYIFNLFVDDEYINISEAYASIYDAVEIVTEMWNSF